MTTSSDPDFSIFFQIDYPRYKTDSFSIFSSSPFWSGWETSPVHSDAAARARDDVINYQMTNKMSKYLTDWSPSSKSVSSEELIFIILPGLGEAIKWNRYTVKIFRCVHKKIYWYKGTNFVLYCCLPTRPSFYSTKTTIFEFPHPGERSPTFLNMWQPRFYSFSSQTRK